MIAVSTVVQIFASPGISHNKIDEKMHRLYLLYNFYIIRQTSIESMCVPHIWISSDFLIRTRKLMYLST